MLPDVPGGLQASRAVGAATAAVGLLGLAGRWGQRTRFWLPVALTWVGSGAVAAFDGLALVAFLLLGTDASAPGWSLTDTVLVIKAAIGVLAGAVGALAVTAATKDDRLQRSLPERVEVRAGGAVRRGIPLSSGAVGPGPAPRATCSGGVLKASA